MRLLAIDPGPTKSAWVMFSDESIEDFGIDDNETIVSEQCWWYPQETRMAVEMVQSFGMSVGEEVFETVLWTGRFIESYSRRHLLARHCPQWFKVYRKDVKLHLCGSMRAKDANIRHALIDRYGGKDAAIGTKRSPGPLYGIKADLWSALAIGVTWLDTHSTEEGRRDRSGCGANK